MNAEASPYRANARPTERRRYAKIRGEVVSCNGGSLYVKLNDTISCFDLRHVEGLSWMSEGTLVHVTIEEV